MAHTYRIYFAGDIFDHKDLAGNALLAQAINKQSNGKYQCILPQDFKNVGLNRLDIRNKALFTAITSDIGVFNFDGTDLDSGTVVEFMIAKMLDIPSVTLRTDFRKVIFTPEPCAENWNLMVSGYPRTKLVSPQLLYLYHEHGLEKAILLIAQQIIAELDSVITMRSLFSDNEKIVEHYNTVVRLCGSDLASILDEKEIRTLVEHKIARNLY